MRREPIRDETFDEALDRKAHELVGEMTEAEKEEAFTQYAETFIRAALEEYRDELLALDRPLTPKEARTLRGLRYTLST
jgi:hypothetical protein